MLRRSVIRVVRFRAAHHYGRADWSDERNREAFGDQVRPHEHDYRLEVTVEGPLDPATGFVIDLGVLDAILSEEVLAPLGGQDLNRAIPEVAEGSMQPSTEALAGWIHGRIARRIEAPARVRRVRVWESDALGGEVRLDGEA